MKSNHISKTLSLLLAAVMLLGLLSGCGGSTAQSAAPASQAPASQAPASQEPASQAPVTEDYPTKPIKLIVSWSAGGAPDVAARLLGSMVNKYLGQPFVIENQPGGAAVPGTAATADADPDGYTIGINWGASWTLRPFLLDVPYTLDDFEMVIGLWPSDYILMVKSDSPFQTLDDLVAYAKEHPGELNWAGSNTASYMQLTGEYFLNQAGIECEFIPYEGSRPATVALLGDFVDFNVGEPASATAEYAAGDLRYLCAFTNERLEEFPDVPTAKELGYDVYLPHTQMICAPDGVPADRIQKLHDAIKATLEDEDFQKLATNAGLRIEYKPGDVVYQEIVDSIEITKPLIEAVMVNN
jgi:tripartite-type tricarboxylate transporter receptor subunit TctC